MDQETAAGQRGVGSRQALRNHLGHLSVEKRGSERLNNLSKDNRQQLAGLGLQPRSVTPNPSRRRAVIKNRKAIGFLFCLVFSLF